MTIFRRRHLAIPRRVAPQQSSLLVIGAIETGWGVVNGIGAGVLIVLGPETWIIAAPMASQSLWTIDGIMRIKQGIDALNERDCD